MTRALAALHHATYGGVYYSADLDFTNSLANPTWTRLSVVGLTNTLIRVMQVDWADPYNNIYVQLDNQDIFHWNGSTWTKILDEATARTLAGITGNLGYIATDRITPGVIYIAINQATVASKVLKSTDYGTSWNVYTALTSVFVTGEGYISAHGNSVWLCSGDLYRALQYSANGGQTWSGPYDIWPAAAGGETINIDPQAPTYCYLNHEYNDYNLIKASNGAHTVLQNGVNLGTYYQTNHADTHWFDYYTAGHQRIVIGTAGGLLFYYTSDDWTTVNTPTLMNGFSGFLTNVRCMAADIGNNNNMLLGIEITGNDGLSRVYAKVGENMTAPWSAAGANFATAPYANSVPGVADGYIAYAGLWVGEGPSVSGVKVYANNWETLAEMDHEPVDPLPGDRASWYTQRTDSNAIPHKDYHAEDIFLDTPQIHNPWPAAAGLAPVSDGAKYVATDITTQAELTAHTGDASAHHAPVTLDTDADTILGLSTQQITLDTQAANRVLAGPTTGAAADPTFRALVLADLPGIALDDLSDVATAGQAAGKALVYNGSAWTPAFSANVNLPYGSFSSSANQGIASATTAYAITYTDREVTNQITLTESSKINILVAGTYLITFSAVAKSTVANKYLDIWLAVGGTNVARSNTHSKFVGTGNERIITVTYIYDFTAGQYFQLFMHSDDTGTTLAATAAGASPTRPASPSIIVTVNKISNTNSDSFLLMETGDRLLLETGDKIFLE